MVIDRIASSMIPKRAPFNYLRSHIGMNPDLYGPFWIIITLVFNDNINYDTMHLNYDYHFRYFRLELVET